MRPITLSLLLFFSCVCSIQAQQIATSKAQLNLSANFPSGKVRAYNDVAQTNLNLKDGILDIVVYNQSFEFKPALKSKLKKEVEAVHQHTETRIKAQITNIRKIDFTQEGNQPARVIGRFMYNDKSTTFYDKAQISIEHGEITLTISLELLLVDFGIVGVDEDERMLVDFVASLE